jgi:hypothetical protein
MKRTLGTIFVIAIIIMAGASAGETAKDSRFIAYDNGTVLDTQTNLMWAAKDNGSDISWAAARSYCDNYRGGGYTDWRMPTLNELNGLYDRSVAGKNGYKLTSFIELTSCCLWASQITGLAAAYFLFDSGTRNLVHRLGDYNRALPVRSVK